MRIIETRVLLPGHSRADETEVMLWRTDQGPLTVAVRRYVQAKTITWVAAYLTRWMGFYAAQN